MRKSWLIATCGALLVVSTPRTADAADRVTGLEVKSEVRTGYKPASFPAASSSRLPFVVSPREAWESGANSWSASRRAAFATDPSVRATGIGLSAQSNVQRADRDPAQWLPATSQRCGYVAKWIAVKVAWGLSADQAEVARLRRILAACPTASTTTTSSSSTTLATNVGAGAAPTTTVASVSEWLGQLARVRISPEYTAGYDRDLFPHWKDIDADGCDTRKEVLIRDSRTPAVIGASCAVVSGSWYSPYDGASWTNPADVDIDHVVALNEAWQSGAYAWTTQQRTNFANDLTDTRTLLAVTDSVNQSKSDKDPADWLPPLASYRCTYLASWVAVKVRWSLTMDEAEHAAVKSALGGCGTNDVVASPPLPSETAPAPGSTVATYVSPGAFCSPFGATGVSEKGVSYTCKPSDTESRNRWRR